jgi:ribosomal protein L4
VALLQLLGIGGRRPEPHRDVIGDVVAAERQDARVPDGAVAEEGHVRGPAPQVDQQHAELLLLG